MPVSVYVMRNETESDLLDVSKDGGAFGDEPFEFVHEEQSYKNSTGTHIPS